MNVVIAFCRTSCHSGHSRYDTYISQLHKSIDCFPPLMTGLALSYTVKATLQEEAFCLHPTHISQVPCLQCAVFRNRDLFSTCEKQLKTRATGYTVQGVTWTFQTYKPKLRFCMPDSVVQLSIVFGSRENTIRPSGITSFKVYNTCIFSCISYNFR